MCHLVSQIGLDTTCLEHCLCPTLNGGQISRPVLPAYIVCLNYDDYLCPTDQLSTKVDRIFIGFNLYYFSVDLL